MTQIITSLAEISPRYQVLYCDLWGCLHNGREVFPAAVDALRAFRAGGGIVILLTNSPRPRKDVRRQLAALGAPEACWDDIACSGDAAQQAMAAGLYGRNVYHLGPERDLVFFEDEAGAPLPVERVPFDAAEGIVCTGLLDDTTESPEDYRLILKKAQARGLKMLCANPDIIVDRGDQRIYCGGALGALYTELGGTTHYYGKPHAPIYRLARERAEAARGAVVPDEAILCVGDGVGTDIAGGIGEGLDTLFVTGGLAAEETGTNGAPDPEKLAGFLESHSLAPTAAMGQLK